MGLVGVGVLIWGGFAAWPWLMRLLGPQIGFVRALSNLWLVGGLVAWVTLVFYVMFKRALLSWVLLVAGLIGAWLSIVLWPEIEMGRDRDFGAAELTEGIELLFDPSARGDVRRSRSGALYMTDINRPGTLIGVPPELSARATLHHARLSKADGKSVSGESSFLMKVDRAKSLLPETLSHREVGSSQMRSSSTLISGETSELEEFVNQHCTYQAEAEVTLFEPEIVYRVPMEEAGAWRDERVAIRVEEVKRGVFYTSRQLRRTCLPRKAEPGYLKTYVVSEPGQERSEPNEVVFVRERALARTRLPLVTTGMWIGHGYEPLDEIVIPKTLTSGEAKSFIARIANARGAPKAKPLLALGADHLPAILRAGRASSDVNFRNDCHVVCRRLAQARHRELIIKYNAIDFDLCGLMMDRGWLGAEALEVMIKEAELNPWKLLPVAWVEAMASSEVQKERALKILGGIVWRVPFILG